LLTRKYLTCYTFKKRLLNLRNYNRRSFPINIFESLKNLKTFSQYNFTGYLTLDTIIDFLTCFKHITIKVFPQCLQVLMLVVNVCNAYGYRDWGPNSSHMQMPLTDSCSSGPKAAKSRYQLVFGMVRNQGWVFALHSLRALSFISDTEQEQQQERLLSTVPNSFQN